MDAQQNQSIFSQQQQHQSQVLSPKMSFPSVQSQLNISQEFNKPTYYLTKNKSQSKQSKTGGFTGGMKAKPKEGLHNNNFMTNRPQSPSFVALNSNQHKKELDQVQQSNLFKKRHVSQIQDRMHTNNIKNMQLIQRQIQANTNMTKNRLAVAPSSQNFNNSLTNQSSVRAYTVAASKRQKFPKQKNNQGIATANKTFYNSKRDHPISSSQAPDESTTTQADQLNKSIEQLQQQTWTSNFQPFSSNKQEFQRANYSYAATRFMDQRRKQAHSQLHQTESNRFTDTRSLSKEVQRMGDNGSAEKLSSTKQILDKTMDGGFNKNVYSSNQKTDTSIQYKVTQDQDSFLDATLSAKDLPGVHNVAQPVMSPSAQPRNHNQSQTATLFARTELDGKRIVNNISEIQNHSRYNEDESLTQLPGMTNQLQDMSVMLSQSHYVTQSKMGLSTAECHRCKVWKRINQECRNFNARTDYKDFDSVMKFFGDLGTIDSIKRMTPELSKALSSLKDELKCQYEAGKVSLETQVFKLKSKLEDTQNLAEKYKDELDTVQKKFDEINNYISDMRWATIKGDQEHQKFVDEEGGTSIEDIMDARASQARMDYSALDNELADFKEACKEQHDQATNTVKYITDRVMQNKQNSAFHLHLGDIFLREEQLQRQAAREFMRGHFKFGLEPPVQTFDKGTVTAENMISGKYDQLNKAEKFKKEMEKRQKETITQVKVENSLLCQQNMYLKQDLADSMLAQEAMEMRIAFFKDLDVDAVRKAQQGFSKLKQEKDKFQNELKKSEETRGKIYSESKRLMAQQEHMEKELQTTIEHNIKVLEVIMDLRRELTNKDLEIDNYNLDKQVEIIREKEIEIIVKAPGPTNPKGQNMFKRPMEDQRKCVIASLDVIKKLIAQAHSFDAPVLATGQMIDKVFKEYKDKAHTEQKTKFKKKIAKKEEKEAELKAKHAEELAEAYESLAAETMKTTAAESEMRKQATQLKENAKNKKAQDAKLDTLQKKQTMAAAKTVSNTDASEIKQRKSTDSSKQPPRKLQSQTSIAPKNKIAALEPPKAFKKQMTKVPASNNMPADNFRMMMGPPKKKERKRRQVMDANGQMVDQMDGSESDDERLVTEEMDQDQLDRELSDNLIKEEVSGEEDEDEEVKSEKHLRTIDVVEGGKLTNIEISDGANSMVSFNVGPLVDDDRDEVNGPNKNNKESARYSNRKGSTKTDNNQQSLGSQKKSGDVPIMGSIGSQKFGLVLEESRHNSNKSLRSAQSGAGSSRSMNMKTKILNKTQTGIKSKKLSEQQHDNLAATLYKISTQTAGVTASGNLIDMEQSKLGELEESNRRTSRRMDQLKALMTAFQNDPYNHQIKKEYFTALKEEYGQQEQLEQLHPLLQKQPQQPTQNSLSPPPPHNLYPGDRLSHSISLRDQKKKQGVSVSPARMITSTFKKKNAGLNADSLLSMGEKSAQKRVKNNVEYNSKQTQCELIKAQSPNAALTQTTQIMINKDIQVEILKEPSTANMAISNDYISGDKTRRDQGNHSQILENANSEEVYSVQPLQQSMFDLDKLTPKGSNVGQHTHLQHLLESARKTKMGVQWTQTSPNVVHKERQSRISNIRSPVKLGHNYGIGSPLLSSAGRKSTSPDQTITGLAVKASNQKVFEFQTNKKIMDEEIGMNDTQTEMQLDGLQEHEYNQESVMLEIKTMRKSHRFNKSQSPKSSQP